MPVTILGDQPLRDVLREKIRAGIAEGRWGPGARLVERDLAEEFAVSRVPVREALRALESEGFVELLPRRGAVRHVARPVGERLRGGPHSGRRTRGTCRLTSLYSR